MKHFAVYSEAIREGAKLRPQGFGALLRLGNTCAIGSGLDAMDLLTAEQSIIFGEETIDLHDFLALYPYLNSLGECPVDEAVCSRWCPLPRTLFNVIIHLNDQHRWTREAIADWLSDCEEKLGYVLVLDEPILQSDPRAMVPINHCDSGRESAAAAVEVVR